MTEDTPSSKAVILSDDGELTPATDQSLLSIQAELVAREPIFHHPEFGTDRQAYESMTVDDFFEIGASGRRYGRNYVIETLIERYSKPYEEDWEACKFHCRKLAIDTYLLTYDLLQGKERHTRRSTIWQSTKGGWKIVYHQGTVVE